MTGGIGQCVRMADGAAESADGGVNPRYSRGPLLTEQLMPECPFK